MSTTAATPTLQSVLDALSRERLFDLGRVTGTGLRPTRDAKRDIAATLTAVLGDRRLPDVLAELGRDELRAVCRAHGLPSDTSRRSALVDDLLRAAGLDAAARASRPPLDTRLPQPGQVLVARGRTWLVERTDPPDAPNESALLCLACLDDDDPGRKLELLWDLELGARVIDPQAQGLDAPARLDPPAMFGAYLHALEWSAVSAADATRFQAPFRAGIKLMAHQLTPLMKALELPRANLFIADDVGLGKTIEAGLVLQELILRQQAGFVLIICPASVTLQWRDEMMRRFGLRFEVMSRAFLAHRRRERGFGVNPWSTHNHFIVSTPLIRRPEYRDPLLAHLGHRAEKGLLILDEAHVAAPASASKYAVDSDTTRALRDLAPKFDNRLFLSATPHNGHSNSFSALLEILDPARFTRGVPISGPEALEPVMVRRLKRDLRQLGVERFPERILCKIELTHEASGFSATLERLHTEDQRREPATPLGEDLGGDGAELELAQLLARYTELCAPGRGRGQLVFVNLQKRLLSSPEAFARTLEVHAQAVARQGGVAVKPTATTAQTDLALALDTETYGEDDDALDADEDAAVVAATAVLPTPRAEATALLERMRALAARTRRTPDAKARALLAWLREHLCPAIGAPSLSDAARRRARFADQRVIIFTEYADTKRYLLELLSDALTGTDRADERILTLHGGMGDDTRDEVQRAFNTPPAEHPVRILVATDAAREGVNLQAFCADLFHFDVPWNPSRMEQRNGRIDRTLQPAPEVRCHYFVYSQRPEDRVLDTLVHKLETVQRELGSVGAVLMDTMERTLEAGIDDKTAERIERLGADDKTKTAERELETQRKLDKLAAEVHRASQRLERSAQALQAHPDSLRGVVELGLRLAGADGLTPGPTTSSGRQSYVLPTLDRSWDATLDTLRPTRGRKEDFWEWRRKAPRAVTFEPLATLGEEAEQLHLAHPLVRRILDRFVAQGYGAHDLSRVSAVVVPGENVARALAYARLTFFGHGAARLHDELIAVAAPYAPASTGTPSVEPYKDSATAARARDLTERALAAGQPAPRGRPAELALQHASKLYAAFWPHLEAEADARATDVKNGLTRRARKESDDLAQILTRQRQAITKAETHLGQSGLFDALEKDQKRQIELDLQHLTQRRSDLEREIIDEPRKIEALYAVTMIRLAPVGLVIAWPESMT